VHLREIITGTVDGKCFVRKRIAIATNRDQIAEIHPVGILIWLNGQQDIGRNAV
jgi:hypothetical protein